MERIKRAAGGLTKLVVLSASLSIPSACTKAPTPEPPRDPYASAPGLVQPKLREVVNAKVAELSKIAIAPTAGVGPGVEEGPSFPEIKEQGDAPPTPDAEEVRGLTEMLAESTGKLHELALRDASALGPMAIGELTALAIDSEESFGARAAAMEVLAQLSDTRAEITLLELLRTLPEPGLRTHAAWRLALGTEDCIVPALVLRMKYENDLSVLQWIATGLAKRGNFAGVEHLLKWADDPRHQVWSEGARATADALAREIGLEDGPQLAALWRTGDPDRILPQHERSVGYELACYIWMQRLADYQLRGVDDSRYVLSRLDSVAALAMGSALRDENVYVRTHVAQALARMGPRAKSAVPQLIEALADGRIGARAARALGAIGATEAETDLLALTSTGVPVGLRLASVRALAELAPKATQETETRLHALFEEAPSADIWQAAGEGLLARDADVEILHRLAIGLEGKSPLGPIEPRTTTEAVRAWFQRRAEQGDAKAQKTLGAWDAAEVDSPYFAPATEDVQAMEHLRQELATAFVPD